MNYLVRGETLNLLGSGWNDLKDVESNSLRKRSALSNNNGITVLATESRRDVGGHVLMSLLETLILIDVVQVVSANDDGSGHLCGLDHSLHNSSSDGNVAGEWALLVDVSSLNGLSWGLETQTNVLVVSVASLPWDSLLEETLDLGGTDVALLKVSSLVLKRERKK